MGSARDDSRLFPLSWTLSARLAAAARCALTAPVATVQDCPTAQAGKVGVVVERGDQQKTEIFQAEDGVVRAVTRYNDAMILETPQHEGLFQLDRLDNGRRTKYEPQTELRKLFPLKPGRKISAKFLTEGNGQQAFYPSSSR